MLLPPLTVEQETAHTVIISTAVPRGLFLGGLAPIQRDWAETSLLNHRASSSSCAYQGFFQQSKYFPSALELVVSVISRQPQAFAQGWKMTGTYPFRTLKKLVSCFSESLQEPGFGNRLCSRAVSRGTVKQNHLWNASWHFIELLAIFKTTEATIMKYTF